MPIPNPSALPALTLLLAAWRVSALDNGLALGPPMGWSSWNAFHDNIKEADIRKTVDQMKALGLVDLGYVYFNIDGASRENLEPTKYYTSEPHGTGPRRVG